MALLMILSVGSRFVSTTTLVTMPFLVRLRRSSMVIPSIMGILISRRIRSGLCFLANERPSLPLLAIYTS